MVLERIQDDVWSELVGQQVCLFFHGREPQDLIPWFNLGSHALLILNQTGREIPERRFQEAAEALRIVATSPTRLL